MFLRAARLKEADVGGAVVRTAFRMGSRFLFAGTTLTAEEVMKINPPNRMALIDKGYIAVWPKGQSEPVAKGKRYAVHLGAGHYDVIEGRRLNTEPMTREEAKALAEGKEH